MKILVPVDFGPASTSAVKMADALALGCGAEVTLLHAEAIDAPAYFTREQVEALAAERRQRQAQAQRYLELFGRRHLSLPATSVIETRTPVEAIVARAADADLVVMGTHGRTGPRLWWMGSVAERVLRELQTPVLIVHGHEAEAPTLSRLAVHAAPGLVGANALALAQRLGTAFLAEVVDRRADTLDPATAFSDVSMVVVAEPRVHDRLWRTRVGEPLIRAGAGPVLFVPEGDVRS